MSLFQRKLTCFATQSAFSRMMYCNQSTKIKQLYSAPCKFNFNILLFKKKIPFLRNILCTSISFGQWSPMEKSRVPHQLDILSRELLVIESLKEINFQRRPCLLFQKVASARSPVLKKLKLRSEEGLAVKSNWSSPSTALRLSFGRQSSQSESSRRDAKLQRCCFFSSLF